MTGRLIAGLTALAALMALGAAGPLAAQGLPERDEYAWRFPLAGGDGAEFRAAVLPPEVYRSVTDPNLRDIGVYNAAGQAVPRVIDAPEKVLDPVETAVELPLVPLYGEPAEQRDKLRLLMEQGAGGTTLSLDTRTDIPGDPVGPATAPLQAYIVDLRERESDPRGREARIEALRFEWHEIDPGFIGTARVETGDDLQTWRAIGRGTLADLAHEGTRIVEDRVELNSAADDFLRITWTGLPRGWELRSLIGIEQDEQADAPRDWLALPPATASEDGRTLTFDAGGFPPVDRVNLLLPGDNVVVRAGVYYRASENTPWRRAHEGVFYHVSRQGNAVTSAPADIGVTRASQWQVRIESGAAGENFELQLGWRPERLLYVAQGEGPFALVTGRARAQVETWPQQRLLGDRGIFRMLREAGEPGIATIGAREPLAGEAAMSLGMEVSWRTALVWIGLIGAVLLVGWLAVSLMKEMRG